MRGQLLHRNEGYRCGTGAARRVTGRVPPSAMPWQALTFGGGRR
ncbi:MAG TPA: hypothetical protein VIL00_00805 [Pseudonocardiaceae bacterium]